MTAPNLPSEPPMTQDNSSAQLLPCPFCGSEMESSHGAFGHIGGQPTCPIYYTAFDDAEAGDWNTRAPVSQDAEQLVERLRTIEAALTDVGADIRELRLADAHAARTGWEGRWDRALHAVCQHENRIKTLLTKGVATEAADLIEALTRPQPSTGLD